MPDQASMRSASSATSSGVAAVTAAKAASKCQRARSGSSMWFEIARTSIAGTPASCAAQHTEALHGFNVATRRPADASTRADGARNRRRQGALRSVDQARCRLDDVWRPRRWNAEVAVLRFGSDHERGWRKSAEAACTGNAHVQDERRTLSRNLGGSCGGGVNRPHAAEQRAPSIRRRHLPRGGRYDEDASAVSHAVKVGLGRGGSNLLPVRSSFLPSCVRHSWPFLPNAFVIPPQCGSSFPRKRESIDAPPFRSRGNGRTSSYIRNRRVAFSFRPTYHTCNPEVAYDTDS
jgi:hypothetical protein